MKDKSVEVYLDGIEREKLERRNAAKWFLIHGFFLITWTPLIWVASGDLLEYMVEGFKYKSYVQWGCGSSAALLNIYKMVLKVIVMSE